MIHVLHNSDFVKKRKKLKQINKREEKKTPKKVRFTSQRKRDHSDKVKIRKYVPE